MWLLQPAGVPGAVFMVPAAVVWPIPTAIALSWIGNMGASSIAFVMARWFAHDWAQARLPERLRRWDTRLAGGSTLQVTWQVTLLRFVTGQLTPADWLLGVSTVSARAFLVGTGIGIIPGIVLFTHDRRWPVRPALRPGGSMGDSGGTDRVGCRAPNMAGPPKIRVQSRSRAVERSRRSAVLSDRSIS